MPKGYNVPRSDSDLQKRLGAVIRRYRHNLGITQEELAWRAEMHRTYLADLERGARNVTLRTVANLAKALHITVGNLFAHITTLPGTAPRAGAELAPGEVGEFLLVEHNKVNAALTAHALKRTRIAHRSRIVRDGETGLDYLFGTGRYAKRKPVRPQLILLNPNLPMMSAMEFLQRVRSDERTRDIPVIVLKVSR